MSNERDHAPYHERRLEQQQLDVLLRIEELLNAIEKALAGAEEPEEVELATADIGKDGKPSGSVKAKTGKARK